MTGSIRVQVTAEATGTDWRFTLTCPTCPEVNFLSSHDVPAFFDKAWERYPKPSQPCENGCEHNQLCEAATSTDVTLLLSKFDSRKAEAEKAGDLLGRYLFDTLLKADWPDILNIAVDRQCEVIEVALTWGYDGTGRSLSKLPWELMRNGPNRCLCPSENGLSVAVTRVIADTTAEMPGALSVPPRVLFVVGTPVDDPVVRAGAEMLALLSEFRRAGVRIQHRILDNAKPATLREAMRTFKPEIVHFISHGQTDDQGNGTIALASDDGTPQPWRARNLLENLAAGDSLPPVVVLSACDTASRAIFGPQHTAPLAAELIQGGIPVVVAMAGKISDRAARIFTRYLGRELAMGETLVTATAHARRVAFAENDANSSDWALPAVFFSAAVKPDQVQRTPDPTERQLNEITARAGLNKQPVFCAREKFLRAFWAMLGDGTNWTGWEPSPGYRPSVLVVHARDGQPGIGKTRLLIQMAREALQNGHLPLMIGMETQRPAPQSISGLATALAEAMRVLGRSLGVGNDFGNDLRGLFHDDRQERRGFEGQEVADLVEALDRDADQLREAAAREHHPLFSDKSRMIVLIDNVGDQCRQLLEALFAEMRGLNDFGLGVSSNNPIPVVLVVLARENRGILEQLGAAASRPTWLFTQELHPFDEHGEDVLAYERILLNPSPSGTDLMKTPWVFNRSLDDDAWDTNVGYTRRTLKGIPAFFDNQLVFNQYLDTGKTYRILINAEDIPAGRSS